MMLELAVLTIFPAAMLFAASYDLFTMTIPNWVSLMLIGAFLALAPFIGLSWAQFGAHLAAGFGMLVIGFFFFTRGWIGGGDAKFFAATALWIGADLLLAYAVDVAILGGILTALLLALSKVPLPRFLHSQHWLLRLHDLKSGIPYGIALAIAGLLAYPQTMWMTSLT